MAIYWLDANVYIQSMRGPFGFDSVPQFWTFLSAQARAGKIKSPKMVYDEILEGKDVLAKWIKSRNDRAFCVTANNAVHENFKRIATHVMTEFPQHQAAKFLGDGDPWVIAHAMENSGIVVTHETARQNEWKIKIPRICAAFNVRCINTYDMNRELEFTTRPD